MTEKSFAATPCLCRDEILDSHVMMLQAPGNFIWASGQFMSKLKDFEGIHVLLDSCIFQVSLRLQNTLQISLNINH